MEPEKRNAKDFGFDFMVYENGMEEHSTEFELSLQEKELENLKLRDLIGMMRVASNANKTLKIKREQGERNPNFIKLQFLKKI